MKKQHYVVDLHVHIGRTNSGAPVKITAASSLTLRAILDYAETKKGIDIVGVIDCHVPEVIAEIRSDLQNGECFLLEGGGIQYPSVTLILGTEIELYDEHCQGPIHVLAYFPTLDLMETFSDWLASRMKNRTLSSQRIYASAREVQKMVHRCSGLFIPAHVFTPFKSLYGKGVKRSLKEVFDPQLIDAVELGLSSDTNMADYIAELHPYPYVTNSDAHSLEKLAREYQVMKMEVPSFQELRYALKSEKGRKIVANYGLNPLLGKYYQTICAICSNPLEEGQCSKCPKTKIIKGVSERIKELGTTNQSDVRRPPYVHQVPLEFIPKLGKKTLEKLRNQFGTDMQIIHHTTKEQLIEVVHPTIASAIIAARGGELELTSGGGGTYGKVKTDR